jgi:hypothetical protein
LNAYLIKLSSLTIGENMVTYESDTLTVYVDNHDDEYKGTVCVYLNREKITLNIFPWKEVQVIEWEK